MSNFQVVELGSNGFEDVLAEGLTKAKAVRIQQSLTGSERVTRAWLIDCGCRPDLPVTRFVVEEV